MNEGTKGARVWFHFSERREPVSPVVGGPGNELVDKVLVAFDGSENSLRAAHFAAKLMDRNPEGTVTFIHVVPPVAAALDWYRGPGTVLSEATEMEKAAAEATAEKARTMVAEVRAAVEAAVGDTPLKMSIVVEVGDPARAIVEYAERGAYDLIVMGSRGLNPVKGVFLGSVSYKVLCTAPCPVLIVR